MIWSVENSLHIYWECSTKTHLDEVPGHGDRLLESVDPEDAADEVGHVGELD